MLKSVIKEEIKVPAQVESVAKLRDFCTRIFHKHKVEDAVLNAFKLSIDEAATNIVKYGETDSNSIITLRFVIRKESVTGFLIDTGKYFDPMRVSDPDLQHYVRIRKKGGLGIFIIRKLMDSLEYTKTDEGNQLKLTKLRSKKSKLNISVPPMSITLKARYSLISSAILTLVVLIGYFYYYVKHEVTIVEEKVTAGSVICKSLSDGLTTDIEAKGIFNDLQLSERVKQKKKEFPDLVDAIIIVEPNNNIYYSTDNERFIGKYKRSNDAEVIQPNVKLQTLESGQKVYDITAPIDDLDGEVIGYTHILMPSAYIENLINAERARDLTSALIILVLGYISIVVVIYMVMSPFQKLAEWVRALGHGDEIQEKMDITESGEIGEIARAFSDITSKFKDSQKRLVRQEQLQKEMQVAKEIQQTLLPTEFPKMESYEIGAFYEAAKEVGGDYFDFVEVDNDSLGIVVADVSGKGVPGSLVMTMIRTALRTESRGMKSASEVLAKVNNFVVNDMKKGMFVTVFYVIIDSKRRRLNYASAGHNPMILFRASTRKTYFLNPRGFPIGISLAETDLFTNSIESDTIQLKEDDILLLYTDGITEAMNRQRKMFGEERLLKTIREYGHLPVQPFVEKIRNDVHSFTEGFPQNDDITLVVIKEESSAEKVELKRAKNAHRFIQTGKSIRAACEEAGITTYAYYNKYKRKFEEEGIENVEVEDESISLEAKHLSVEEKTKIYDIIKQHPEYGAKRICEELNSEKYGFTEISESRIYDELVRSRLNTKQLRESFITRSKRGKRIKPPGTPMLTLDGEVIIDRTPAFESSVQEEETVEPVEEQKPEVPEAESEADKSAGFSELSDAESLLLNPLENILNKKATNEDIVTESEEFGAEKSKPARPIEESSDAADSDSEGHAEDAGELLVDEPESAETVPESEDAAETADADPNESDFSFENLLSDNASLFQESEYEDDDSAGEKSLDEASAAEAENPLQEQETEAPDSETTEKYAEESSTSVDEPVSFSAVEDVFEANSPWEDAHYSSYESDEENSVDSNNEDIHTEESSEAEEAEDSGESVPPTDRHDDDDAEINYKSELTEIDDELAELIQTSEKNEDDPDLIEAEPVEVSDNHKNEDNDEIVDNHDEEETLGVLMERKEENGQEMETEVAHSEKLLIAGLQLYRRGLYDDAIEKFEKLIQKFPNFKEAHSILGNAYFRNQMYTDAAREYQKVKLIDPANLDAYENMGVIYANTGDYEKAIQEWEHILEVNPKRQDIKENIKRASELLQEKLSNEMS